MSTTLSIKSGLAAHFKQVQGPSLPGVSWLVRIDHDGAIHHARVMAMLAPEASKATRRDKDYQARTTMQYLMDQIEGGWNPAQPREHTIHIGDPLGGTTRATRPWWKFW